MTFASSRKEKQMMNLYNSIDCIMSRVNSAKKEPEFSKEIEERLQRSPKIVKDDKDVLREFSKLIAFSQNAKSNLVSDMLDRNVWEGIFHKFEVYEVAKMNAKVVEDKHWEKIKVIRFRRKIRWIIGCAKSLTVIRKRHGSFSNLLKKADIPIRLPSERDIEDFWAGFTVLKKELREVNMPFFKRDTSLLHFLLHAGYDCIKPDLVVMKVAKELGIVPSEKGTKNLLQVVKFVQAYSVKRRIKPSVIDFYLLIYGGQLWARQFVHPSFYGNKRKEQVMNLNEYLSKSVELRTLYKIVKQDFIVKGLVHHNWNHVRRDLARGIIIAEKEQANMKIVLAGILLHDIGRLYPKVSKDHYSAGAKRAPKYLKKAGCTDEEIKKIVHCIRSHGPRALLAPKTKEAKVCYDVDVLSCSVGYLGVARVFDYFMREMGMNVKQMVELPSGRRGKRKDFYTETGKMMGEGGLLKAKDFWKKLEKEFAQQEREVKKVISNYVGD
jgi:HD superfamily phosphodiesterase